MKLKIYPTKDQDEKEINKFIESVDVVQNGVKMNTEGRLVILYYDKEENVHGLTKDQQVALLSEKLGEVHALRLSDELEYRAWQSQLLILGKKDNDKHKIISSKLNDTKNKLDDKDLQIRLFNNLIKEVKDSKFLVNSGKSE